MREARALLERVELPDAVLHRRPHALSGGERKRVNLARALAAGPAVLLCDEITSALDPELSTAMAELLARLSRELDVAVLLITHELPIAARIADEIAVLDAGARAVAGLRRQRGTRLDRLPRRHSTQPGFEDDMTYVYLVPADAKIVALGFRDVTNLSGSSNFTLVHLDV
jgi:ABC-type polar amino acid transport system ATPase subunit